MFLKNDGKAVARITVKVVMTRYCCPSSIFKTLGPFNPLIKSVNFALSVTMSTVTAALTAISASDTSWRSQKRVVLFSSLWSFG